VSDKTRIDYVDASWNPVTGCTKVSEGCRHCFAEQMFRRKLWGDPFARASGAALSFSHVACHAHRLDQPLRWSKPRRILVPTMGDLFHPDVPDDFIDRVLAVMALAIQHQFFVLTKRPERMCRHLVEIGTRLGCNVVLPDYKGDPSACVLVEKKRRWPLPNVSFGVSVENKRTREERVPWLLKTPAAGKFISAEPLLEDIGDDEVFSTYLYSGFTEPPYDDVVNWVIAGCETGPRRRPAKTDWFRSLRDQCTAASVPFFLKQMEIEGRVVRMPPLDGREWRERPEVRA
jgi:protein gp37